MKHPRDWTPEDRQLAIDFHTTFTTPEGVRVLAALRETLWDTQSAVVGGVLLDDRSTVFNEGRRDAFATILGYIKAYDIAAKRDWSQEAE